MKIVRSEKEPDINNLWLHKVNNIYILEYFCDGWCTLGGVNVSVQSNNNQEVVDGFVFNVSIDPDYEKANLDLAASIPNNTAKLVEVKGNLYGTDYDVTGTFYNGKITTLQGDRIVEFDINYNTGEITRKDYPLDHIPPYIELHIGDSQSVKDRNLELLFSLTGTSFMCRIGDYSFGTGRFLNGDGGTAFVETAQGVESFYRIYPDGKITKLGEYLAAHISDDLLQTTIADTLLIDWLKVCGKIVLKSSGRFFTNNVLIEFNRSASQDNTSIMEFLALDSKGDLVVIAFNTITNRLELQ